MNAEAKANHLTTVTRVILLTSVYFLGGMLGKAGAFVNGDIALVWPPAGIALAAILLFGYRFLPGVAFGAFVFSFMDGKPLGFFTLGTAIGNSVGAMICAYLLQKSVQFQNSFQRVRDVAAFVVLASVFGTTVNALFNVASLHIIGKAEWDSIGDAFVIWWVPNALGCLVVTPFLVTWAKFKWARWGRWRIAEAALCWLGLILATTFSFETWYAYGIDKYPLAFLPYPFAVWAALRFGIRGATLATLLVAGASIHALVEHRGPFFLDSEKDSLLLIGSYIAVFSASNLFLAAAATERAKALDAVIESEERVKSILGDGILTLDELGYVLYCNPAAERMFGCVGKKLVAKNFRDFLHPNDLSVFESCIQTVLVRSPFDMELQGGRADGSFFPMDVSLSSLQIKGRGNYVMVARDISERKAVEEQLRHADRLDTIGQLAAGVAHDFNNILSVISGQASLLTHKHGISGPPARAVEEIRKASERAAKLTRQLLMFSRKQAIQLAPMNLNVVVTELSKMLHRVLGDQISLVLECSPQPLVVQADETMFDQVLMNLAVNARDAMPDGGTFVIATGTRHFGVGELRSRPQAMSGIYAWINVTDTGGGIPSDVLPRIFEPFFTTKEKGKGTGLGLSIVYGIVRQHQGWIDVRTQAGKGTTFEIFLPLIGDETSPSQPASNNSRRLAPKPHVMCAART